MRLQITGWRARNLRGYLREVNIDFSENPKRWTLMQMPNGTGKTTTMKLLRDALTGKSPPEYEVQSLKADDAVEDGLFELALLIDDEQWLVGMHFDFRSGQCSFSTVSVGDQSGGKKDGYRLPVQVRNALKEKTTELFVFDGELASEIIESGATRADESIRALYKLDSLAELKTQIGSLAEKRRRKAASISSASTRNSIERFEKELKEVSIKLSQLESDERNLRDRRNKMQLKIEKLEKEISELSGQNERYKKELSEIKEGMQTAESEIFRLTSTSIELFRKPPLFHKTIREFLKTLGGTMQALKLPRTMSAEFFFELSEHSKCICGSSIGETERSTILSNAKEFLGNDQIAVINQMKLSLRDADLQNQSLEDILNQLRSSRDRLQILTQRKHRIEDDPNAPEFQKIEKFKNNQILLKRDIESIDRTLRKLTSEHPLQSESAWQNNIPACKREKQISQKKLDTATGTYEFVQKADALKEMIGSVERRAVNRLRSSLKDLTNERLEDILPNEQLRVANIKGSLELTTDNIKIKSSVSEGQKLAVSYAFLTALLARAPHKLPFVVDSPAVSLDVEIRRTVGKLIPPLFDQMIIFVISSEREGFSDMFFEKSDVDFFTIALDSVTGRTRIEKGYDVFRKFHADAGGT